jgi:hypothetical protein
MTLQAVTNQRRQGSQKRAKQSLQGRRSQERRSFYVGRHNSRLLKIVLAVFLSAFLSAFLFDECHRLRGVLKGAGK